MSMQPNGLVEARWVEQLSEEQVAQIGADAPVVVVERLDSRSISETRRSRLQLNVVGQIGDLALGLMKNALTRASQDDRSPNRAVVTAVVAGDEARINWLEERGFVNLAKAAGGVALDFVYLRGDLKTILGSLENI